jgi:hypothetical protein
MYLLANSQNPVLPNMKLKYGEVRFRMNIFWHFDIDGCVKFKALPPHNCQYTPSTSVDTTIREQTQNYVIYILTSCEIWGYQSANMKNVVFWYTTPCSLCVLVRTWVIRWLGRELNEQASILCRSRLVLYHNPQVDDSGAKSHSQRLLEAFSPGLKRLGRETNYTPPFSAKSRMHGGVRPLLRTF